MSELKISKETEAMADEILACMEVGESGSITVPADTYEKLLPEDIPMAQATALQAHNASLTAASALAMSKKSLDLFKKDNKLDSTSLTIRGGKDVYNTTVKRKREVPVNAPGEPRKLEDRYLNISSSISVGAAKGRGELKAIKQWSNAVGADVLSS